jgi:amino acid transporter
VSAPAPLPRTLGSLAILLLALSATTPASSLFVIVPGMLAGAGTGALLAMALAGVVCLGTAFLYAELSSAFPNAGGEYVMVARTLGPLAGFVVLVVNLFNNMLFPPVVGLGLSAVLAALVPGLPAVPVAALVVAGACGSALLAIRTNALVTGLFLALEVATLLAVAGFGFGGGVRPVAPLLLHPGAGAAAIGTATTVAIFALNGYGMAVYFGEEMRDAARRIGRVVVLSFAAGFLLELLPLVAGLAGAPSLPGFLAAADPFGELLVVRGGRMVAGAAAIGVATAIANAAIVTVLASARFLYATARDGIWGGPLDRALARVSRRFAVPWVATIAVGAVGVACCRVSLLFLLVLSGAGLVVTYFALGLAALAGRVRGTTDHAPYRMPFFPLAPLVTMVALAGVVWASWLDPEEGRPGLIATALQMLGAVLWYAVLVRTRGPWRPADPVGTEPAPLDPAPTHAKAEATG